MTVQLITERDAYAIEYVQFDLLRTPGQAVFETPGTPRNFQISDGYAFDGQVMRFKGNGLAEIEVEFVLFGLSIDPAWDPFHRMFLRPDAGKRAKTIKVAHPRFSNANIRLVVCKDYIPPSIDKEKYKGNFVARCKFGEYREPRIMGPIPRKDIQPTELPRSAGDEGYEQDKARIRAKTDALVRRIRG